LLLDLLLKAVKILFINILSKPTIAYGLGKTPIYFQFGLKSSGFGCFLLNSLLILFFNFLASLSFFTFSLLLFTNVTASKFIVIPPKLNYFYTK